VSSSYSSNGALRDGSGEPVAAKNIPIKARNIKKTGGTRGINEIDEENLER
jgi:hypothetical protein